MPVFKNRIALIARRASEHLPLPRGNGRCQISKWRYPAGENRLDIRLGQDREQLALLHDGGAPRHDEKHFEVDSSTGGGIDKLYGGASNDYIFDYPYYNSSHRYWLLR